MSNDAQTIIGEESERFAAALASTDPERPVPTCPEWTAADLLWHLTEVHELWAAVLAERATTDEQADALEEGIRPRPESLDEVAERRAAATADLIAQLGQRDDDEEAWFWYAAQRTVGVIRRMQTHEAIIHRVDAELTAGRPVTSIAPEIAAAGLEHVLIVMWPSELDWIPDWARTAPVATVDLAADDQEPTTVLISRWQGTRPRDGQHFDVPVASPLERSGSSPPAELAARRAAAVASGGATGDLPAAAVTGTAQALNLWAWGRGSALEQAPGATSSLRVTGDDIAVHALMALIDEGID